VGATEKFALAVPLPFAEATLIQSALDETVQVQSALDAFTCTLPDPPAAGTDVDDSGT
jgi:hypothetical protein